MFQDWWEGRDGDVLLDRALDYVIDACIENAIFAGEGVSGRGLSRTCREECPAEVVAFGIALVKDRCAKVEYGNDVDCESKREM